MGFVIFFCWKHESGLGWGMGLRPHEEEKDVRLDPCHLLWESKGPAAACLSAWGHSEKLLRREGQ